MKRRIIYKRIIHSDKGLYFTVAILSVIAFICLYGVSILNPAYTDWLLSGGDLSQHYLGWKAFRNGAWRFPIGLTDRLAYPGYTSVIFTDSIPLFAIIFKILSPILPESFQYFGLWGIMCFVLQGCLSARILRKFTENKLVIIVSSILLVFSPVMIYRMYVHTALAGQWILLLLLCPLLAYDEYKEGKKIYIEIALAAFFASSTHMYLVLMCGIILLGICLRDILENRKFVRTFLILTTYIVVALFTIWILGGFSSAGVSFPAEGLGYYSMNYNALYNPQGYSSIFQNKVQYTTGQYEGFGYLGAGDLLLFVIVAITFLGNGNIIDDVKIYWKNIVSVVLVIAVISFVASSPIASFNDIKLYELTLPELITKVWSIFRACGRIVMVLPYVIVISLIIIGRKITSKRFASILMLICLVTQLIDIKPGLNYLHQRLRIGERVEYQSPLESPELWGAIAANQDIEHIIVTYWIETGSFYDLGEFATNNDKTLNAFAMVHPDEEQLFKNVEISLQEPTEDEIFIFSANDWLWAQYHDLNFYDAGNYVIGYSEHLNGFEQIDQTETILTADFTSNQYLVEGKDEDGRRTINPGGISYGPYWFIPIGDYRITIDGDNLQDTVSLDVHSDGGAVHRDFVVENITDDRIEIALSTDEDIPRLEITLENISTGDVIMNNLTIEKER